MTWTWQNAASAVSTLKPDELSLPMIKHHKLHVLGFRLLLREWRSGALGVMFMALLIAIISHTSIGFFTDRLNRAMEAKAAHLMGGDLVVKTPTELHESFLNEAINLDLKSATTLQFSTVMVFNDEIQLSAVKAVSDQYPLTGFLKTATESYGDEVITQSAPQPGSLWVEQRLLNALNAQVGDKLVIGDIELPVTRIVTYEPDRGGMFYTFAPRVIMNITDITAANVIQPGSRVDYRYLFLGAEPAVTLYKKWLAPRLQKSQQILGIHGERPTVSTALIRAEKYMSLAGLVAILLAAVAIAMSARHYAEGQFDASALLRCMGLKQNDLLVIYVTQLSCIAIVAALLGSFIGFLLQELITYLLIDILPAPFPVPTPKAAASGMILSFAVLFGFSLPTLIRLRRVSPLRVLRKNLEPLQLAGKIIYTFTTLFIAGLIFAYTQDPVLTIAAILGAFALGIFGFALVSVLFAALHKISQKIPANLRAGLRNLIRRQAESRWQTLAFGTTLMAMSLVIMIRTDLLTTWQAQLPVDAPNHFVLNVLPAEAQAFENFLQTRDIQTNKLFPITRGRLTHINDVPVKQAVTKEQQNNEALNRELSLTEATETPPDNKIIAGEWWHDVDNEQTGKQATNFAGRLPRVSVEAKLADRLGIAMNDTLSFVVGSQTFNAKVSSIRSVKWDSFNPNFYMMFEPGTLTELPITYLTSFYLPTEKRQQLRTLVKQFPAVTLLEVDAILEQVRNILTQVTLAVEMVLLFVLAAGFAVTFAALQASLGQRFQEGALMRTLGASRQQIRLNQWVEFISLGLVSGLMAAAGTETILWACYTYIFHLTFSWHPELWIGLPALGALLVGVLGYMSSNKVVSRSPMLVLRDC
ncbi:MAG: FtsX-like permease family protein [Pseudomonadales bacterium]|nr:FtsX-like permease family protein [Pseudomonadales bacterium]